MHCVPTNFKYDCSRCGTVDYGAAIREEGAMKRYLNRLSRCGIREECKSQAFCTTVSPCSRVKVG